MTDTWEPKKNVTTGTEVYSLETYRGNWRITNSHNMKPKWGNGKPPWPPAPFRIGDEVRRKDGKAIYDMAMTAEVTSIRLWTDTVYV